MTQAAALRALHVPGHPIVLPNTWDVVSAKEVEKAGFAAVATGSGAVSATLGYRDGHGTPAEEMLAVAARITQAVSVPVTVDMEGGYDLTPADLARRLIDAGASGLNFEDGDHTRGEGVLDAGVQSERIAALRGAARSDLVINARIDLWVRDVGDPAERLAHGIERARAYSAAGADSVFPIMLSDVDAIRTFVTEASAPVNIFWNPHGPTIGELADLGVSRISFGSAIHRAATHHVRAVLEGLRAGDDTLLRGPAG